MERKGLVLAYLTKFKQLCNHPSHWSGDGQYVVEDSGKFQRLVSLGEAIAARQETVLVFTQFRELTLPLAHLLARVFRERGLVLHGGTPVSTRQRYVDSFQRASGPPFFAGRLAVAGRGESATFRSFHGRWPDYRLFLEA